MMDSCADGPKAKTPDCDAPEEVCNMLVGAGVGAGMLGAAVFILLGLVCAYPCLVFACGYCMCISPKSNNGASTTSQQWVICIAVLVFVV